MLEVLKMISYIIWSLVGLTVIGSTIWGILFYKAAFGKMFKEDKKEETKLERIK